MGIDDMLDKAKSALGMEETTADKIDDAADAVKEKTPDQVDGAVDKVADAAKDQADKHNL